jgi:hypothetical protein
LTYSGYGILRLYVFESFNIGAGGFYRNSTRNIDSTQNGKTYKYDEKATAMGAIAALGNKWVSKGGFQFALDWVQYEFPLSSSAETSGTTTLANGGSIASALQDISKQSSLKSAEETSELAGIHVGVVKLGFAF